VIRRGLMLTRSRKKGLTQYTTPSHIARATLEAAAFHTRAVLEAMKLDCKESLGEFEFKELKVDGGMTNGDLCMQIQADLGGFKVVRPEMRECVFLSFLLSPLLLVELRYLELYRSTALGSALLAGSALHLFGWDVSDPSTLSKVNVKGGDTLFKPSITEEEREKRWKGWKKAVERSRGWEEGVEED
jgi:glycerol kinase